VKFGRQTREEAENLQMAPMIDIIFVTLICFMTTSVYATLERELDIRLPTASSAQESRRASGEIYINLKEDGTIVLNERRIDLPEQLPELQRILNNVAKYFPGGAVIIRGDREAQFGSAIAILNCCKAADIQDVRFAALPEAAKESN